MNSLTVDIDWVLEQLCVKCHGVHHRQHLHVALAPANDARLLTVQLKYADSTVIH